MGTCRYCKGSYDYIPGIGVCINCKNMVSSSSSSSYDAEKSRKEAEAERAKDRAMDWHQYTDQFGNKVRVSGKTGDHQVKMAFWGWMGSYKGNIEIRYANGDLYVGGVYGSLYHGKGKITWKETGNSYEGDWVYHHKTGKGKYTWANGDYYEGDFVDGKRTGKGKYVWKNGCYYKGDFVDGNFNGYGIRLYIDGYTYEGQFKDDKRHGKGILKAPDGTAVEYYYEDDKIVSNTAGTTIPTTSKKSTAKPKVETKAAVATGVTKKVASAPAVEKVTESDADIWNKLLNMTKAEKDAYFAQNPVLVVPKGTKKIPAACFEKCMNLKEVRLNAELRTIEQSAFASCENLGPELIIPEKVEKICPYAFSGCYSIRTLQIPNSIMLEKMAFFACRMQEVKFQTDPPRFVHMQPGAFRMCDDYLPKDLIKKIKKIYSDAFK